MSGRRNGDIGRGVIDLIGVIVVPGITVLNPDIGRDRLMRTRDGRGNMRMGRDGRKSTEMMRRDGPSGMMATKDGTTTTQKDQNDGTTTNPTTRDPKDATQKTTTNTPATHPTTTEKDIPPPNGKAAIAIGHYPRSRNETNLPARTVIARRDGRRVIRDGGVFIMKMIWNSRLVRPSRKEIVSDGVEHTLSIAGK